VIVGSFCGAFDRVTGVAAGSGVAGAVGTIRGVAMRGVSVTIGGLGVTTGVDPAAGLGALATGVAAGVGLGVETTGASGVSALRSAGVGAAGRTAGTAGVALAWPPIPRTACNGGFPLFTTFRGTPTSSFRVTTGIVVRGAPGGFGLGTTTTGGCVGPGRP